MFWDLELFLAMPKPLPSSLSSPYGASFLSYPISYLDTNAAGAETLITCSQLPNDLVFCRRDKIIYKIPIYTKLTTVLYCLYT